MRLTGKKLASIFALIMLAATTLFFQNCAKSKFIDPDTRHSSIALGLCRECSDEKGSGLSCRQDTEVGAFSSCFYESCNTGYELNGNAQCIPVVCTAGAIANCAVTHGEGRMTCNENRSGYGACTATSCETGFVLTGGACVAIPNPDPNPPPPPPTDPPPPPFCVANSHRDCSTSTTNGIETCAADGSAYGACVLGDCKPGFNKDATPECVANACAPGAEVSCTSGAAVGMQTCNSAGSGFGVCEINGCQPGFNLISGVCVVQVCTPGTEYVCEYAHGSGTKTCNTDGTDFGPCTLLGCEHGYAAENSQCHEQICVPGTPSACVGQSGTGIKYCHQNGLGHGACTVTTCDPGFKLKNNQCVNEDECDAGETLACTQQFGTGLRTCNTNSHRLGPCELNACNAGYVLVNQGGSNACKKDK